MPRTWIVALVAVTACHAGRPQPAPDVIRQLDEARRQFRHGDFTPALAGFRRLTFELTPGDASLPEVKYLAAECQYQLGAFAEAAHDFRDVADQFPQSPYAPTALLRAGDANLRMWRDPSLDPSPGEAALALYQELAGRFPGSDAAARAQLHVAELKEWFAEKEYRNGMFYLRRRAYDSAILYFKDLIANYPETPRAGDALLRLADAYKVIGYTDELRDVCANVRQYHPTLVPQARSCPPDSAAAPN
ncbi:MAG TPA: outer membrane protein assembly factor BamD [Gemmatimonadales bacterium]